MKRFVLALACLLLLFNVNAQAAAIPEVEIKVQGNIEKGQIIDIFINIKNIERFYAGSLSYLYDRDVMKIQSIEGGELIKGNGLSILEFGGEVNNPTGKIDYQFTCTGQVEGFKGSGIYVKIKAEILENKDFYIYSKAFQGGANDDFNLKLQLCERTPENKINELDYKFTGYKYTPSKGGETVKDIAKSEATKNTENKESGNNIAENKPAINGDNNDKDRASDNSKSGTDKEAQNKEPNKIQETKKPSKDSKSKQSLYVNVGISLGIAILGTLIFTMYKRKK